MKWEFETWRKLYTRITPAWAALPALARGIGTELLKYCDDDGRIPLGNGETPGETIVRVIAAQRAEQKHVTGFVNLLIHDGFLVVENDAVVIRNLKTAQEKLSGAAKSARYRARVASLQSDAAGDDASPKPSPHSDAFRHPSEIRSEIRSDLPQTPASGGFRPSAPDGEVATVPRRRAGTNPRAVAQQERIADVLAKQAVEATRGSPDAAAAVHGARAVAKILGLNLNGAHPPPLPEEPPK